MTTIIPGRGVQFRIWAPKRNRVQVLLDGKFFPLKPEAHGYYSGLVPSAKAGSLYKLNLDDDETLYPDPESRFQPEGPHGPSGIVDPQQFHWTDHAWKGVDPQGQIVYELHLGTFTREGTWDAARAQLGELASIGITIIEVMPIAEFSGSRGWGYDGVDLYAPYHHLVIVNLGGDLHLEPAPEPLLAPPPGCRWNLLCSSEDPQYGGLGTPPPNSGDDWRITSCSALLFVAEPAGKEC